MLALGGLAAPAEIGGCCACRLRPSPASAWCWACCCWPTSCSGLRVPPAAGGRRLELRLAGAALGAGAAAAGGRSTGLFAAATLWVLLPPVGLGFLAFAGLFTVASIAGVISHVPAGLGVFEAVLLLAMPEGGARPRASPPR